MRPRDLTVFGFVATAVAIIFFLFFAARPTINASLHRGAAHPYPAVDFAIFYCAGAAIDSGRNPYLIEPLFGCEHRVWPRGYLGGYAEPAALPGYAMLPFAALAKLPFAQAKLLWLLFSCVLSGIAVASGARLAKLSSAVVFALLFVPLALLNIPVGQLGPVLVASILASALLLRAGHVRTAGLVALATMIEPHIGLPVVAALLWFAPRTRLAILIGGAVLFAAHFATLGIPGGIRYFTQVLPAMSHAELAASDQYGTIWALHELGFSESAANAGADVLYALAIASSLVMVRIYLKRYSDLAFIVAVPAVLGLLGAPYLHDVELCGALALPLCALGITRHRLVWGFLAIALMVPWYAAIHGSMIAAASLAAGAIFAAAIAYPDLRRCVVSAAAVVAVGGLTLVALHHLPLVAGTPFVPNETISLAAQSWGVYLQRHPAEVALGLQTVLPKAFTWLALLVSALAVIWIPRFFKPFGSMV